MFKNDVVKHKFFLRINLDRRKIVVIFGTLFNKWSINKKYFDHDKNNHI
jgi:hypothetical protein